MSDCWLQSDDSIEETRLASPSAFQALLGRTMEVTGLRVKVAELCADDQKVRQNHALPWKACDCLEGLQKACRDLIRGDPEALNPQQTWIPEKASFEQTVVVAEFWAGFQVFLGESLVLGCP